MTDKPKGKAVGIGAGLVLASAGLMALVEKWESSGDRVLTVYADKIAGGLPTVCNGLTRHVTDTPIIVGERWTDAKCEAEEKRAMVERVQKPLMRCFDQPPPQSVFDAASSMAWNVGAGRVCASNAMQAWAIGEWALGCRRMAFSDGGRPVWSYAGGKFYKGLHNRRVDEYNYCMRSVK